MASTLDHYKHWSKLREQNRRLQHREIESMKFLIKVFRDGEFLDVGCGDGLFLSKVMKVFPSQKCYGMDFSQAEVDLAVKRGMNVKQGNIEEKFPFQSNKFNIVYAGEVIEHLFNPDHFLEESNRILKEDGYLIISTPNLLAWFNRILVPLGIQPLFVEPSTKSKFVGSGPLRRFKQDSVPVGHVRIFTLEALKDILKMHGFKILEVKGAIYESGFPKNVLVIDNFFSKRPKLSSHFVILAKKVNTINI